MSGIVGLISEEVDVDRPLLIRLTESLSFRGPDGVGVWCNGVAGFGRTLLNSSREATAQAAPFSLDGRTYIVADARIDGRPALLRKLRDVGVDCGDAATDDELILRGYLAWGHDCVLHLLGDFAFAIWDCRRHQLFAARDHFGVKPFFFAVLDDGLLLGNTLNCLRLHPGVSEQLNERAIGDFLLFGFNHDATTTTFADICRLPPAHTLTWSLISCS